MTRPRPTTHCAYSRCTHPSKPTFSHLVQRDSFAPFSPAPPTTTHILHHLTSHPSTPSSQTWRTTLQATPPPTPNTPHPLIPLRTNFVVSSSSRPLRAYTMQNPRITRCIGRRVCVCWISFVGGGWRAGAAAREGRSTGPGPSRDPNRLVSGLSSRDTEAAAEKRLYVTVPSLPKREVMRHRSVLVTKVTVEGRNCILQVHGYGYIPPHDSRSNLTLQQITGTAKESTVSYSAFSQ